MALRRQRNSWNIFSQSSEDCAVRAPRLIIMSTSVEIATFLVMMAGNDAAMPGYRSKTYLLTCGLVDV